MVNRFPIECIEPEFATIISEFSRINVVEEGLVATSILNSMGFFLSNSYVLEVRENWEERANIWGIIATHTGLGKSVTMKYTTSSIVKLQNLLIETTKKHNALYDEWLSMLKANKIKIYDGYLDEHPELRNWLSKNGFNQTPPVYKPLVNVYVDDFTFEKLGTILEDNAGHALCITTDELLSLFKCFNAYRKGSDDEKFLKLWSYAPYKADRVTQGRSYYVKNPTISVMGATQPDFLSKIFTDDRKANGNIFRFLFAIDKKKISTKNVFLKMEKNLDSSIYYRFLDKYLTTFIGLKGEERLRLNPDCLRYVGQWRDKMEIKYVKNQEQDVNDFNGIMGKMDSNLFRVSIILHAMHEYINGTMSDEISLDTITKSSKIIEYYINEIFYVMSYTNIGYKKHLKDNIEIDFYENVMPNVIPLNELTLLMEKSLSYSRWKIRNKINKWVEVGVIKVTGANIIHKNIEKVRS